jgi:hypothetical protein
MTCQTYAAEVRVPLPTDEFGGGFRLFYNDEVPDGWEGQVSLDPPKYREAYFFRGFAARRPVVCRRVVVPIKVGDWRLNSVYGPVLVVKTNPFTCVFKRDFGDPSKPLVTDTFSAAGGKDNLRFYSSAWPPCEPADWYV